MRNKTKKENQSQAARYSDGRRVKLAVQGLESFKKESGYDYDYFLGYMNKNNIWELTDNRGFLGGIIWAEMENIVYSFGKDLEDSEKQRIIDKCNKQLEGIYSGKG